MNSNDSSTTLSSNSSQDSSKTNTNNQQNKGGFQLQIRYVLLPLMFALIIYGVYLANYLGAFKSVVIAEKEIGPLQLVFKTHIGAYHKINDDLQFMESWAKQKGIDCKKTFGEYLDNPDTVDEKRLRANVGCLVDQSIALTSADEQEKIQQKTLESQKYVTAEFLGASSIGPIKVYPRVKEYFKKMNYEFPDKSIEIYEIHSASSMTTQYLFEAKLLPQAK